MLNYRGEEGRFLDLALRHLGQLTTFSCKTDLFDSSLLYAIFEDADEHGNIDTVIYQHIALGTFDHLTHVTLTFVGLSLRTLQAILDQSRLLESLEIYTRFKRSGRYHLLPGRTYNIKRLVIHPGDIYSLEERISDFSGHFPSLRSFSLLNTDIYLSPSLLSSLSQLQSLHLDKCRFLICQHPFSLVELDVGLHSQNQFSIMANQFSSSSSLRKLVLRGMESGCFDDETDESLRPIETLGFNLASLELSKISFIYFFHSISSDLLIRI